MTGAQDVVRTPGDCMRSARRYQLVASGASIRLIAAAHGAYAPVAVRPGNVPRHADQRRLEITVHRSPGLRIFTPATRTIRSWHESIVHYLMPTDYSW